jgi:hypothetical protein
MKEFAYFRYFEVSPSPRSIGIIDLAGKCDLIYGAQQLAGKILCTKDLCLYTLTGIYRLRLDHDGPIAGGGARSDVTRWLWKCLGQFSATLSFVIVAGIEVHRAERFQNAKLEALHAMRQSRDPCFPTVSWSTCFDRTVIHGEIVPRAVHYANSRRLSLMRSARTWARS